MNINKRGSEGRFSWQSSNRHHLVSVFRRDKHFTGIFIYKRVIIKIKPRTCDNQIRSNPAVNMTWAQPPASKTEKKKKTKTTDSSPRLSFRHIFWSGVLLRQHEGGRLSANASFVSVLSDETVTGDGTEFPTPRRARLTRSTGRKTPPGHLLSLPPAWDHDHSIFHLYWVAVATKSEPRTEYCSAAMYRNHLTRLYTTSHILLSSL